MELTNDWILFISVCGAIITFTAYAVGVYVGYNKGKNEND